MSSDAWDLDTSPSDFGDADVERFKWAWNEAQGELVWRVGGPGDGRPVHEEQVRQTWGREASLEAGDVFGVASYAPETGAGEAVVSICAYSGVSVPAAVSRWFELRFPGARLSERAG